MAAARMSSEPRLFVLMVSLGVGGLAVAGMHYGFESAGLADLGSQILGPAAERYYPLSIQNAEWLVFFVGLGELLLRYREGNAEFGEIGKRLLPEDDRTVLGMDSLPDIYRRVRDGDGAEVRFLPRLILRIVLGFQSSSSISQANALMNSSLDMFLHEIDLRYNMLRYTMWLIPSLGFIGTVVGIAQALRKAAAFNIADADTNILASLTTDLGIAFDTTMLALALSIVLVFLMHIVQGREEAALNKVGQYCLDNLVNRLY